MIEQHLQKQEKQQMLDTLVGGIAHELNNKLTPVLGFAQLLELEVDERGRSYLGYIGKSVEEAARIIRQLLQLSKPQIGAPEVVSLATIVGDVVTMLKFQLREAKTAVHTLAPPEPIRVFADPAQLKQVVMNLVINALHAMEEVSHPRLEITINRQGASGWLEFADNGSGIPANVIGRIFDPFFTTKGPDKGSGLGLSICASLVRQQGGELAVTSVVGQGARFSVRLPLAASDVVTAAPFARFNRADSIKSAWAGLKVLIVEDELVVRHFLQEALRTGFGCRVDVALDGVEGLRRAVETDYALVVSDVRMPGLNGPELYRKLAGLRPAVSGRFVFVTGHEGEQSLGELLSGASVPVMAKPFTMQQLQEVCGPILNAAAGRR
jgi:two-component system NtrC family sensor kinase